MERGRFRSAILLALAATLCIFTALAANLQLLGLRSGLVIFLGLALIYGFLHFPLAQVFRRSHWAYTLDWILVVLSLDLSLYLAWQFESPQPAVPQWVGLVGVLLLLEGSRRVVGLALPLLVLLFGIYGFYGSLLPSFLLPHRGFSEARLLEQCFLPNQGIFGSALAVTFRDAYLMVVFGVTMVQLGGPVFLLQWLERRFGSQPGGAAKLAVVGGGLLGSIAVTPAFHAQIVGPYVLPRMRRQGIERVAAAGTLAAATLGGVLAPPVLGVGAYLMLTLLEGQIDLPGLLAASLLPGLLYFFSLYLAVVFRSRRDHEANEDRKDDTVEVLIRPDVPELRPASGYSGWLLAAGLGALLLALLVGWPVSLAAPAATLASLALAALCRDTRPYASALAQICRRSAEVALPLILAAAAVGVVLGIAELTGLGGALQALFPHLAANGLFPALLALAFLSLLVGLGLPSPVVYLLLALLLGPAVAAIGPLPLAAHFFLLYFSLMATLTPPLANAAQVAAGMAGARLLPTSLHACRLSLVGFALPFLIVYRPQLLMIAPDGGPASVADVTIAFAVAIAGALPLAAAESGYLGRPLGRLARLLLALVAWLIFYPAAFPPDAAPVTWTNLSGVALLIVAICLLRKPAAEKHSQN